jgi:hypothetical protein
MPIRASERDKYPDDWPAIRERILTRAERRCEFLMPDGRRCNAPDRALVWRAQEEPERWSHAMGVEPGYAVLVVLTVAHLNHDPRDCRDENLRAGCQLHHLRHDAALHRRTAAATRRAAKQTGELFEREDV